MNKDSLSFRMIRYIAAGNGVAARDVLKAFPGEKDTTVRSLMSQFKGAGWLAKSKTNGHVATYSVSAKGRNHFGLKSGTKNGAAPAVVATREDTIYLAELDMHMNAQHARTLHDLLNPIFG